MAIIDKLMIWGDKKTATQINSGWNAILDLGFSTKMKNTGNPLYIAFKSSVAALAGGTSVAFTISSGDDAAGADTTHAVFTLTLAQMNAGIVYTLPNNSDTYVKVTAAAATGTFTGAGCLSVYEVLNPSEPF